MPTPGEHKTVQTRILEYAEAIGWAVVYREEAEQRRGFDPDVPQKDPAKGRSLFFDDWLDTKVREFNPRYAEAEGALLGKFRHFHTDIYGNRGKFFDHEEMPELFVSQPLLTATGPMRFPRRANDNRVGQALERG